MVVYLQDDGKHYIADLTADLSSGWCYTYERAYENVYSIQRSLSSNFKMLYECETEAKICEKFSRYKPQFLTLDANTHYEYW